MVPCFFLLSLFIDPVDGGSNFMYKTLQGLGEWEEVSGEEGGGGN